jgi:hypothetical protein
MMMWRREEKRREKQSPLIQGATSTQVLRNRREGEN